MTPRFRYGLCALGTVVLLVHGLHSLASTEGGRAKVDLPADAGVDRSITNFVTFDPEVVRPRTIAARIVANGGWARPFSQFPVVAAVGKRSSIDDVASVRGVKGILGDRSIDFFLNAGPRTIHADDVRDPPESGGMGIDGSGTTVGVIDSGVDATHPDLSQRVRRSVKFVAGQTVCINFAGGPACDGMGLPPAVFVDRGGENSDTTSGHGSHVAGIVAGDGTASGGIFRGVAPGAHIDAAGVGDGRSILWVLEAYEFMLAHAAEDNVVAINNSWGIDRTGWTTDSEPPPATDPVRKAVQTAISRGIAVVFSAGNSGCSPAGNSTINPYALIPGVISVASAFRDGQGVSEFSSCGRTADSSRDPTLMAPGSSIVSVRGGPPASATDPLGAGQRYVTLSGTSMSAPHTSGAIALIQSARSSRGLSRLSPSQLTGLLRSSAIPLAGVPARQQGAGMIDVATAVRWTLGLTATTNNNVTTGCNLISDPSGDANMAGVRASLHNTPSLDIVEGSMSTSEGVLTTVLRVSDLNFEDSTSGTGVAYDVDFIHRGRTYTIRAFRDTGGKESYRVIDATKAQTLAVGSGSMDASDDAISISIPTTVQDAAGQIIYSFASRDIFHSMKATGWRVVGTGLVGAENAMATQAYLIGSSC